MSPLILIVEDDVDNRALMSALLTAQNYRTIEAHNGRRAVEMARNHRPDLILMDMSMPIVNGYEATRLLKADPRTATIPVVAVTAYDTADDQTAAATVGCVAFLRKPLSMGALHQTLARIFGPPRQPV